MNVKNTSRDMNLQLAMLGACLPSETRPECCRGCLLLLVASHYFPDPPPEQQFSVTVRTGERKYPVTTPPPHAHLVAYAQHVASATLTTSRLHIGSCTCACTCRACCACTCAERSSSIACREAVVHGSPVPVRAVHGHSCGAQAA